MGSGHITIWDRLHFMFWILAITGFLFTCQNGPDEAPDSTTEVVRQDTAVSSNFDNYTHPYLTKAISVQNEQGRGPAEEFFIAALSLYEKEKNWTGYSKTAIRLAKNYLPTTQKHPRCSEKRLGTGWPTMGIVIA